MKLNDALFNLLNTIRNTILSEIKNTSLALAPMQFKSLKIISQIEACTGQKLTDYLGRDKAQINRLIKELVEKDLVTKTQCEQDKRSQIISLTENGKHALRIFTQVEERVFSDMLKDVSSEEKEIFTKLVLTFKSNLNNR
jgi:DNA-binding MarR family transcriptional regulator